MPLSAESNWFQLTSASLLWVYGNDSTHELWYGICASIACQHVPLLNLGISCVETSASGIKIPLWFDKSIGQSYQEPCQIYQNQKNMVQWANEEKTLPAGFGVSFSGKDAKCNKIISSLTEPWKPIRPKKKKQFTPGSPRRSTSNRIVCLHESSSHFVACTVSVAEACILHECSMDGKLHVKNIFKICAKLKWTNQCFWWVLESYSIINHQKSG